MLHLRSYLQIKAKNYDKVEKVSICYTVKAYVSLVCVMCLSRVSVKCSQIICCLSHKYEGHFSLNTKPVQSLRTNLYSLG